MAVKMCVHTGQHVGGSANTFHSLTSYAVTDVQTDTLSLGNLIAMDHAAQSMTVVPTDAISPLQVIQKQLSPIDTTMLGRTYSFYVVPSEKAHSPTFVSVISPALAFSKHVISKHSSQVAITISKHASDDTLVFHYTFPATQS